VRPYLEKPFTEKIGLVEWLKVQALNSNPSTTKKVVESLPSRCKVLSSNPRTTKKKFKRKKN
jgi:hypothetical protein